MVNLRLCHLRCMCTDVLAVVILHCQCLCLIAILKLIWMVNCGVSPGGVVGPVTGVESHWSLNLTSAMCTHSILPDTLLISMK